MYPNKKAPLISIVVGVYNLENYISECLDSILNQDFDDYEIIVGDNASTDKSVAICQEYAKKYPDKVKFIFMTPPNIPNKCTEYASYFASGDYIWAIDGDDYLSKGCLKEIAKIIKEKSPDIIMGRYNSVVESGITSGTIDAYYDAEKINNVPYIDALKYLTSLPSFQLVVWRYIVKRELNPYRRDFVFMNKDTLFNNIYIDAITTICLLNDCNSIYFYNGDYFNYRFRVGSMTTKRTEISTEMCMKNPILLQRFFHNQNTEKNLILRELLIKVSCLLFLHGIDLIKIKNLNSLIVDIESNLDEFLSLRIYNIGFITRLCDLVEEYGALKGVLMFDAYERGELLNQLNPFLDKNIYVFPTGIAGVGTARVLKNMGFNVMGFFDNDNSKHNKSIMDIPCRLPSEINTIGKEEKENMIFVISVVYESLSDILRKQLLEYGIREEQIIIRKI